MKTQKNPKWLPAAATLITLVVVCTILCLGLGIVHPVITVCALLTPFLSMGALCLWCAIL